ncbi:hypothetical protein DBV23_17325 [Edwardsiella ictaluri]|uniref:Uncharacterized protein n=2 Tax=Edwardsiella ictaluri TaxID=67780 RepID=C5BA12_EDWI9|nr:hypothetical protein [Edwardsiella ictaluri]ACR69133.2 hypothetical protein NT01EI_1957 [Edwardsiella ictaluri 93-146]ARD38466.1 hypothetical protein B6E78_02755 [Edwardsiella ictaluri]AVZ83784.1 hypothetical protein DBV23_17325 [Edwardsiella ictaluri]KMQ77746.1 hypothetical protein ABY58_12930 [Edwardsiella ictaluri]KOO54615.1 hypothetical protein ACS33_12815 [Edwardsiella ictaluri]
MSDLYRSVGKPERVCFDYTHFLSASCNKRWRFVDAICGVMPLFGMVTRDTAQSKRCTQSARIRQLALQVLSTQVSDETNILRLIELVNHQGLPEIEIQLPYALEESQLSTIRTQSVIPVHIELCGERLLIALT